MSHKRCDALVRSKDPLHDRYHRRSERKRDKRGPYLDSIKVRDEEQINIQGNLLKVLCWPRCIYAWNQEEQEENKENEEREEQEEREEIEEKMEEQEQEEMEEQEEEEEMEEQEEMACSLGSV